MSSSILQDERIKWIRQRVVLALEIQTSVFDDYFSESSDKAKQGVELLQEYISGKHAVGSTLLFSCKSFSEEIEGKVLNVY